MAHNLDRPLEDIIKSNKKTSSSGRGDRRRRGGSGSGSGGVGPTRRSFKRSGGGGPASFPTAKAPESAWQHDMYSDFPVQAAGGGRVSAIETGTKLYISNLDYGVSSEDIKELFSEVGDLKRYAVHYDRSGRSKGTAEVVFARRPDGVAAVKKYNNVQLDGKPMKIEIVGTNIPAAAPAVQRNNDGAKVNNAPRRARRSSAPSNRPKRVRGGKRRGGGSGGGGKGEGRAKPASAEELDADLEKYHAEAMQIN